MAFMSKFKKKKDDREDPDQEDLLPDWGQTSSIESDLEEQPDILNRTALEEEPEEEALDPNRFRLNTVSLTEDADSDLDDPDPQGPLQVEDTADTEDTSSISGMMDIFTDEIVVDKQLSNLNSWVEEVEAVELLDEARSILEEMEKL